ncbi:hypothetical protein [uncultured Oscillibacter sp.]|uniref:hypothetical protein n=1 Tax=uncultured Oscillibacter sp. TaxID=876091 RepID=UPI0025D056C2|nr:hypothetical protein [uncultured Oscillibacter sp.]
MTKEELYQDLHSKLYRSMWECVALLDQGRTDELRETMMTAIEKSEYHLWHYDYPLFDMEEVVRKSGRKH